MELEPIDSNSEKTKITFEDYSETEDLRGRVAPSLGLWARIAFETAHLTAPLRDVDLTEPVSVEVSTDKLPDIADSIDKRRKKLEQLVPNQKTSLNGELRKYELSTLKKPITIADKNGNRTPYIGVGTYLKQQDEAARSRRFKRSS